MPTRIAKWGNSLAVRIPVRLAREARLREGDTVEVGLSEDGGLVIRPAHPRYTLDDLVAGIAPDNRHHAADWGTSRGFEPW